MAFLDISIIATYLIAILTVGIWKGRKEKNTDDFFLGNRKIPWFAVLGSIVATEISAATYLGVPAVSFAGNMNYLQYGIGSLLARFFVAAVFLSAFYKFNCVTIYDYLAKRFGGQSQVTASIFFILTRLMASGVRLMIAANGFAVILDLPFEGCLVLFTALAVLYTSLGGIKAVIWTDCIQGVVFIAAGIACLWFLQSTLGWSTIWEMGQQSGHFDIIRLTPEQPDFSLLDWFNDANLLYVALLFGFVSTTAAMGTDQDLTQRMLTCKNVKEAKRSIILSGFVGIPVTFVFLLIGIGLYVYFNQNIDPQLPASSDDVFGYFIRTVAPTGLKGLLIAGVLAAAMSSLDSAMAALSSSAVVDLLPSSKTQRSDRELVRISRLCTIVFAVILAGIAYSLRGTDQFLWLAFKLTGITYGSLLGIFLLGTLTKRGNDRMNVIAMISGSTIISTMLWLSTIGKLPLAWNWLIIIGVIITLTIGLLGKNKPSK